MLMTTKPFFIVFNEHIEDDRTADTTVEYCVHNVIDSLSVASIFVLLIQFIVSSIDFKRLIGLPR